MRADDRVARTIATDIGRRAKPIFIACLAAVISSGAVAQEAAPQDIAKTFEERVLVRDTSPRDWYVTKWESDIRLGIVSDEGVAPIVLEKIVGLAADFERASGKSIVMTTANVNFNIFISAKIDTEIDDYKTFIRRFFASQKEYDDFFQAFRDTGSKCGQKLINYQSIAAYFMLVAAPRSDDRQPIDDVTPKCILSGFLRGFGVEGEAAGPGFTSSFELMSNQLSETDKSLLKLLYNPRVVAGTKRDQVMAVVRQLAAQMSK